MSNSLYDTYRTVRDSLQDTLHEGLDDAGHYASHAAADARRYASQAASQAGHYAAEAGETLADVCKGAMAGALGGLAAAWVMNQFQAHTNQRAQGRQKASGGGPASGDEPPASSQTQQTKAGGEPATVKAAEAVSRRLFEHDLSEPEKRVAEPVMHYAMGAVSGAVYGAVAEVLPIAAAGLGLPFGMAVWLVADEAAVPALGLSKPPTAYPLPVHADALAAHLVYGLTTDLFRRVARTVLL